MKLKTILFCLSLAVANFAKAQLVTETHDVQSKTVYPILYSSTDEMDVMIDNLKYKEVSEKLRKNITQAKRRRKDTSVMEAQLERCNRGVQFLRGTDHVVVFDSVVVDKQNFLKAYNLSEELGKVVSTNGGQTTEFTTQLGNRTFASEPDKESLQLFSYYVENGRKTDRRLVEGLDVDGDINYPFLMSDGSTLYFAARSTEGLGNYDIYITRYDSEDDKYYKAESLGFPYNSYANDYMMVVDEENNIGWFASDRYQPEGKVCIYMFIPNSSRRPYDYENDPQDQIITAARLLPISATWTKENAALREQAKRVVMGIGKPDKTKTDYEFTLVINDRKTYHYYTDFRSAKAKLQCREWLQKAAQLTDVTRRLEAARNVYHRNKSNKSQVLSLEQQYEKLLHETAEAEKLTRNLELQ